MKKRQLLALGLLCGVMLPLSTQAGTGGISVNDDGSKTVVRSDDVWGDISLTIASGDLEGSYYWGFNEKTENSVWDDYSNPGTGIYMSGDGKIHGGTYGLNDVWGGGGDNLENGFNSGPNRKRQGPCPKGWHVPSRGEWADLFVAWCNINNSCNDSNIIEDDHYDGAVVGGISGKGIPKLFKVEFNFIKNTFRSSTPISSMSAEGVLFDEYWLDIYDGGSNVRRDIRYIRCFKDPYELPEILPITFLSDDEYIRSGEIESGSAIPAEIISGYNLKGLTKTGYNFSGWVISGSNDIFNVENGIVTTGMILNAVREVINYEIKYELDGGINSENNTGKYTIETPDITLENPTKDGYNFDGWFLDTGFTTQITEITQGSAGNIILYAKWTENKKPSGGSSSGGGGRSKTSNDSQISPDPSLSRGEEDSSLIKEGDLEAVEDLDSNTPMDSSANASEGQNYSQEFQQAYEFAKEKGITTMPTINDANMNGKLTRIAMAKMLSYYAINVLGMKPDETRINKFNDITEKLDAQYDSGVTLAYQLGVMGINMPDNNFRPNDEVTRAEFSTALSRMLYSTPDGKPYYTTHLEKLKTEKILTNDDYKMKELRGYVMIMLMRSSKK